MQPNRAYGSEECFKKKIYYILIMHIAQYKGNNSFANTHVKASRNFFEASHGKSQRDEFGTIIWRACLRAVKANTTVKGSAISAYEY